MLGFRVSVLGFGVGLRLRIGLWVRDGVRFFLSYVISESVSPKLQ